jgi:hypothetical protein
MGTKLLAGCKKRENLVKTGNGCISALLSMIMVDDKIGKEVNYFIPPGNILRPMTPLIISKIQTTRAISLDS